MNKIEIICCHNGKKGTTTDYVVNEHEIKLFVNQKEEFSFQTYPLNINDLVTGFLASEKLISSSNDVINSTFVEMKNEVHIHIKASTEMKSENISQSFSSRYQSPQYSMILKASFVIELMNTFIDISTTFKKTGAVHTAAIATNKDIEYSYDDIGRHNAIDKCVGKALKDEIDLKRKILLVTCRISSGIITKVINNGIPIIISRAPPTLAAIDLAQKKNTTIVGFCRGTRFNVYSHPNRIIFQDLEEN